MEAGQPTSAGRCHLEDDCFLSVRRARGAKVREGGSGSISLKALFIN